MDEYLIQPLRDLTSLFERLEMPYALMGGIAVSVHGVPRPTHDLDFTVSLERPRLPELYAAASQHGYSVPEAYASGWIDCVANMPLVRLRQWAMELGVLDRLEKALADSG